MATSASKTTILLNKLYRKYKNYLESTIVDAEPDKVIKLLQTYLSDADKALLSTPDKKIKATTLKTILIEKMPESKENFLGILKALNQFFNTGNIIRDVKEVLHSLQKSTEQDKSERTAKKRPQPRIPLSHIRSDPGSTSSASSKAGLFKYRKRKISSKTQPTPLSLDSSFNSDESRYPYQQPVEASIPEHTIIPQSSQHSEVVATPIPSQPTSRRLSVGQRRTQSKDVYDEIGVIAELDKLLGKIIEEKHVNVDEYKTRFSVVMNLHKRLTDTYQQEKEQLKEDMQRIEQEAKEEKEYLLKENKALMENDLVKQVKDKGHN